MVSSVRANFECFRMRLIKTRTERGRPGTEGTHMAHFMNSEISTPLNNDIYTEYDMTKMPPSSADSSLSGSIIAVIAVPGVFSLDFLL